MKWATKTHFLDQKIISYITPLAFLTLPFVRTLSHSSCLCQSVIAAYEIGSLDFSESKCAFAKIEIAQHTRAITQQSNECWVSIKELAHTNTRLNSILFFSASRSQFIFAFIPAIENQNFDDLSNKRIKRQKKSDTKYTELLMKNWHPNNQIRFQCVQKQVWFSFSFDSYFAVYYIHPSPRKYPLPNRKTQMATHELKKKEATKRTKATCRDMYTCCVFAKTWKREKKPSVQIL